MNANGTTPQHAAPTTALAPRPAPQPAPFEPENIGQAEAMADRLAKSTLLPAPLRGKPSDVFLTILIGRELGLSAASALTKVHVIEGKPSLSADLAVGLVKKNPACAYFRCVETTDAIATFETERVAEGKTRISFTIEQAAKAGLTGKDIWRKYPAAMLRARASMALARTVYPDVLAGVYDPEELEKTPRDVPAERVRAPIASDAVPQTATATAEVVPAPEATKAADAPKHQDAVDAEFTQAPAREPGSDDVSPAEQAEASAMELIDAAETTAAIKALVGKIGEVTKDLPDDAKNRVRAHYGARREALAKEGK